MKVFKIVFNKSLIQLENIHDLIKDLQPQAEKLIPKCYCRDMFKWIPLRRIFIGGGGGLFSASF